MSETSNGEHGPESGHQSVVELMARNEAAIAEKSKATEELQRQIAEIQKQVESLQGQIAELQQQVRAREGEIYKAQSEIAQPKYYHDTLIKFIGELRKGEAGLWGYASIVDGMFDENGEPGIGHNERPSLTHEQKREIVQSVLTETGLTDEEARGLVEKQSEKVSAEPDKQDKDGHFQR